MALQSVNVVPANSGYAFVFSDDENRNLIVKYGIVAWRFDTHVYVGLNETYTSCTPLSVNGSFEADGTDNLENIRFFGVMSPNGTVISVSNNSYSDLEEATELLFTTKKKTG